MADVPDFLRGVLAISSIIPENNTISRALSHATKPRIPKRGCRIAPSTLRPHVLASDRIGKWKTPFSSSHSAHVSTYLPPSVCNLVFEVSLASLEEKTRSNYGAGLLRFTQFCDAFNIPEALRMPAPEWLLAAFAASAAGSVSSSCADTWLSGLSFWHAVNGAPWNGANQLRIAKAAIKKMVPVTSKRGKRPPVTLAHMLALLHGLDLTNSRDAAVYACATCLWKGVCRGGEFLVPSGSKFDPKYHVTRGTLIKWARLASGVEWVKVFIPWSKTTHELGANIILTACDDITNPLPPLRHHLTVNASVPDSAPFFAYETSDGGWAPLTKDGFMSICNGIWATAGYDVMYQHGFRIGGATDLLLKGTPPDIVMAQGRWASPQSFMLYWRKIEEILPLFLSRTFVIDRLSQLSTAMATFSARYK